jgi:hypothetical protein
MLMNIYFFDLRYHDFFSIIGSSIGSESTFAIIFIFYKFFFINKTVVMYNKLMGGVDMADQLLTTYDPNVKSVKLWKKLLMNVLLRITGKSSEINK